MSRGRIISGMLAAAVAGMGVVWVAQAVTESTIRAPDVGRGAIIAAHGVAPSVSACAQCHAQSSGVFPRIAGQSRFYLDQQMHDFASGVRTNAIMTPISKALSAGDEADLAAYYAGLASPFLPVARADPTIVKRGEQLARIGDESRDLQSCNDCHGPDGAGEPPAIPYLAGQYAQYIASQLKMWQLGSRKNSANTMGYIAKRLDDRDIAAVAAYFQQVRTAGGVK